MKNILLILVGGTICTALNDEGMLSVSGEAGALLKSNFEKSGSPYADKVQIDLTENLFILSENMTVEKWNLMADTYRAFTQKKKYDGIIFAHGTDTLAFSASLFSMWLCGTDIPVFFVSANERLTSPRSNGNDNFRCAVECICRGIRPDVYAVYKNLSDGRMYLHLASRLEQCRNYSEDFTSFGAIDISDITEENCKGCFDELEKKYPLEMRKPFFDMSEKLSPCVMLIKPYVGINYSAFDYSRFKAVLHGTFHSGTACSENPTDFGSSSVLFMIDKCAEVGTDTYFSPSVQSGEVYETVGIIGNHTAENGEKIKFLYGCTTETAYAKLILAYSAFDNREDIYKFMETECNFENIR